MKILLVAINAKYIHSNLAVYSLRAYAAEAEPHRAGEVEIVEYTVNQTVDDILMDLYGKRPDVLCFSCYLWNIEYVRGLSAELSKILPRVEIWLGGPEVSYHAERILEGFPNVAGIMCGEGEETFLELLRFYHGEVEGLEAIAGLVYRESSGRRRAGRDGTCTMPGCRGGARPMQKYRIGRRNFLHRSEAPDGLKPCAVRLSGHGRFQKQNHLLRVEQGVSVFLQLLLVFRGQGVTFP